MDKRILIKVVKQDVGQRLDRFLMKKLNIPNSLVQKLIRQDKINTSTTIDGKLVNKTKIIQDMEIKIDSEIAILEAEKKIRQIESEIEDLRVEYEDEAMIVYYKPGGLATQGGTNVKTSVDSMLQAKEQSMGERYRLVHRLDKDTSGLLVVAKTRQAAVTLTHLFKTQSIKKKVYHAILEITDKSKIKKFGRINADIYRDNEGMTTWRNGINSKKLEAVTEYRIIREVYSESSKKKLMLVELKPITGRKHQLRVHCSQVLCSPILGDQKYGGTKTDMKMFLHMKSIELPLLDADGTQAMSNGKPKVVVINSEYPECWKKFTT